MATDHRVRINPEMHRTLRMWAGSKGVSVQFLVEEILRRWEQRGRHADQVESELNPHASKES